MNISGSCHCENITFDLEWLPEPEEIPARACTCTFCIKHGGVWTACPAGTLVVAVRDRTRVSHYRFGTRTAEFHICTRCGVVPVATSRIDGRIHAVVNVNTFQDEARSLLRQTPTTFDDEDEQTRLARRAQHWIRDVRFVES